MLFQGLEAGFLKLSRCNRIHPTPVNSIKSAQFPKCYFYSTKGYVSPEPTENR